MKIMPNGVIYWNTSTTLDNRGEFKKIINKVHLEQFPDFVVRDYFLCNSVTGVIRGMHLQVGEFASNRIIYVTHGKILDVLADLNQQAKQPNVTSETLGSSESFDAIYVPSGIAHGYEVLENYSVISLADKVY